ncbi:hypothetical protein SMB34_19820 [Thalassospira permensis NBRC 106175]|jgi:hypothetical protein|uniref:Uncharacterized protein n=1 Tax=Thalassospira permensis NBRC 106175 TaxID=1353532 RepID=A0ABR4TLL3_9PROT|nr:hypothetical protein SMB34_19820 [Thalassospira permensis NBRC 106175]OCK08371.1 hypothetical protein KO164_2549 [Thalassospira sp. KO164]PXX35819.1 hypothetical protein C7967_101199 [Thalassospira sp. 11-3]SEE45481.1 hypothetical protein SAMN04515623_2569 [Thalassospira permensis]
MKVSGVPSCFGIDAAAVMRNHDIPKSSPKQVPNAPF